MGMAGPSGWERRGSPFLIQARSSSKGIWVAIQAGTRIPLAGASGLHGNGVFIQARSASKGMRVASKLRLDRLLLINRQQAVVDLEREDRQGRVGEPTARGRVAVVEGPAAGLVGDA